MVTDADHPVRTAIVLQGGGALGAYEYGVLKALYKMRPDFRPAVVSGVSIGAITAAVLCGSRDSPMGALEQLWTEKLRVPSLLPFKRVPRSLYEVLDLFLNPAVFFNPGMYGPNFRLLVKPLAATSLYDIEPLRRTLTDLIELNKLNAREGTRVILAAAEVQTAALRFFDNRGGGLTIDKIIACASLPPGLPMTSVDRKWYWDGGLLSNPPLSPAINALEECKRQNEDVDLELIAIELFPRNTAAPQNMLAVAQRMIQLMLASRLDLDKKFFRKIDDLVDLMAEIDRALPKGAVVRKNPLYRKLADHRKIRYFKVVTASLPAELSNAADFSIEAIKERIDIGYNDAVKQGIERP